MLETMLDLEHDGDLLDALPLQLRLSYIYHILSPREWVALRLVNKQHAELWRESRSALHLRLSHPDGASDGVSGNSICFRFPQLRQVPSLELPSSSRESGISAAAGPLAGLPVLEEQQALTLT